MDYRILTMNVGDTSLKIGIYKNEEAVLEKTINFTGEQLAATKTCEKRKLMMLDVVRAWMAEDGISFDDIDAVVIRASVQHLYKSGTYLVRGDIRKDLVDLYDPEGPIGHASIMTLPIVEELIDTEKIPVYLVDPYTIDEMSEIAKITGLPECQRKCSFHALNQKAIARKAAADLGKTYKTARLVVAHMGGGVSVAAHEYGKVIDTDGGSATSGPMAGNRAGGLPSDFVMNLCFSGKYQPIELLMKFYKAGGLVAHLGTADGREIQKMIDAGDEHAKLIYDAFLYQISKCIGEMAVVLKCDVDAIVLTGGFAYSDVVVNTITEYVGKIAPVLAYPGELEGEAMAAGALRVLRGEEEPITEL